MALRPLEISSGFIVPRERGSARLPQGTATPREAFEAALLPALRRAPCLVSFSGGRDSSSVLAVATHVARREGLPLPIPATLEFPDAAGTRETEWQEQVIAHLGLDDWHRVQMTEELDCVGPVATAVLARHGVLWPINAYFHMPLFEAAAGGSLATGLGGDEAFAPQIWTHHLAVMRGKQRPVPRDVLRVGFALAPARVRYAVVRRSVPELSPWLRPEARRAVGRSLAREGSGQPLRWRAHYRRLLNSPYVAAGFDSLARLGADTGTQVVHPFFSPGFLAALARQPAAERHESREQAMEMLVGALLPAALKGRSTKARFDEVVFQSHSRRLIAEWDGATGIDPALVDPDVLRAEWAKEIPDAHSAGLLQSVWLATRGRSAVGELAQPVGGAGQ
jgi:asparagine synthase (glutamine-hydrolysing)